MSAVKHELGRQNSSPLSSYSDFLTNNFKKKRLFNKLAPHQTSRLILVAGEVDAHLTLANGKKKNKEVVGIACSRIELRQAKANTNIHTERARPRCLYSPISYVGVENLEIVSFL